MPKDESSNQASQIVKDLGLYVEVEDGIAVQAMLVVKTVHPSGEVGVILGTSDTATWFDNVALVTAAELVIKSRLEMFIFEDNEHLDG